MVEHRSWDDEWIAVPCAVCGRLGDWPRPELGCPCGMVLRVPVARAPAAPAQPAPPGARERRRTFPPHPIRTADDAVTAAAHYLRRLGYRDVRHAGRRPGGIGLTTRGLLAQVDPTVRPAASRDVECLWLAAMTESVDCVHLALADYTSDARVRADALGVPLFVLDLAGVSHPVNHLADTLHATGAPRPGPREQDGRT